MGIFSEPNPMFSSRAKSVDYSPAASRMFQFGIVVGWAEAHTAHVIGAGRTVPAGEHAWPAERSVIGRFLAGHGRPAGLNGSTGRGWFALNPSVTKVTAKTSATTYSGAGFGLARRLLLTVL